MDAPVIEDAARHRWFEAVCQVVVAKRVLKLLAQFELLVRGELPRVLLLGQRSGKRVVLYHVFKIREDTGVAST